GRRRHGYYRLTHRLERLDLIQVTGVPADVAVGHNSDWSALTLDRDASKSPSVHLGRDRFELLMRSRSDGILCHPGCNPVVLSGSTSHGQHRAGGFAQHHFGDATQQEALETSSPVRGHYDHVGVNPLLSVQDRACGLASMDQDFVLD